MADGSRDRIMGTSFAIRWVMKFKAGLCAFAFSFLLGSTNSYAMPGNWIAEIIGHAIVEVIAGCTDLLFSSSPSSSSGKEPTPAIKPVLLANVNQAVLVRYRSACPPGLEGLLQNGDSLWAARGRVVRVRSQTDVMPLTAEMEEALIQAEILTLKQIGESSP